MNNTTKKRTNVKKKLTAEQKREKRKLALLRAAIYIGAFILFYLILTGIYMLISGLNPFPPKDKAKTYTIKVEEFAPGEGGYKNGKYNNTSITEVAMKDADPILYVRFSVIDVFTEYTVTGSNTKRCYIFPSSEEYATFSDGTSLVIINGVNVNMAAPAKINDGEVLVPLSFIEKEMNGIAVTKDPENDAYYIKKTNEPVSFKQKGSGESPNIPLSSELKKYIADSPVPPVFPDDPTKPEVDPITPYHPDDVPVPTFISDLSAFEQYMNPSSDEYLFLVNGDHKLSASDTPKDLVNVVDTRKDGRDTQKMRLYAEKALEALYIEMRANGYKDVSVTSAYRSYGTQEYLYNNAVSGYMTGGRTWEQAAKLVTGTQSPGASEHQTGLCCDMHNLEAADQAFGKTKAAQWLKENAHKFGFILRYPEDKQDVTKIKWEPWHFRYVGRYHATKMYEAGLCLEEYMQLLGKD